MADFDDIAGILRSGRLVRTELDDETGVLLDVDGLHVFSLNDVGMFIVQAIWGGAHDVGTIVCRMVDEFDVNPAAARADAEELVSRLHCFLTRE